MKIRFAVNTVIPVMILISGLAVIAMQYVVAYRFDKNSISAEADNHFNLVVSRIEQIANEHLGLDRLNNLEGELRSTQAVLDDLQLVVVVDGSDQILGSTDSQWINHRLSEFPELSQIASQNVRDDLTNGKLSEIDDNDLMHGLYAFDLPEDTGTHTHSGLGLVGVVLNQQRLMQIMQEKRLAVAIYSGFILALMTVLLWFLMSRFLVFPLQRLVSTVRSFARGDFTVSANLAQENEMGEISSLLDSLATITMEREKAEASRNRLAQIVEESVSEIYISDAQNYKILNANRAARKNLGYSSEDFQTLMPWDFVESLTEKNMTELTLPLRHGNIAFHDFETVHKRKDGSTYPVHTVLQFMATQIPPVFTAIVQDITEIKNQEQNVKLRDRAIEAVDVGVSIFDTKIPGRPMVYVNRRLCEMSGQSAEQLIGGGPELLRDPQLNREEISRINASLAKGESIQAIMTFKRRGRPNYIGDIFLSPVHSEQGELTHYIGIVRDITARLETEARLNRSQRIEAIGQLAGGVAHDFNNLLSVIIGNIEFLQLAVSNKKHCELLNQADVAAQMGARLTHKLLSFAKQDQLEPVLLDANEQVREAMNLLRTTIGENYHLTSALAPDIWHILADPSGIENSVVNLALNARDAMPEGGQILIETCNVSVRGVDDNDSLGVLPGDYIRLSVSDSGLGMTREIKDRIFEPFFTTKDVGENSGLGLASTYGFAQQSGGNVHVDSKPDCGTVISLLLPRHHEINVAQSSIEATTDCLARKSSRVLVVEDDEMVRDVTVERLHALGYITTQTANGPEAIRRLQQDESFDLVLTDLVMDGGMSGYDVADWVKQHLPQCKVLLTSGYSGQTGENGHTSINSLRLLQKPYKMADLQDAISSILAND